MLLFLLVFPICVNAEVKKDDLETILTLESIEHDLSSYKESDEQIPIYLFYGDGCAYCNKFLTFINSIIPEYGKYFKVVGYEVWNNSDNSKLMNTVANFLGENANGVPFYIIGDQAFVGYSSSSDENIKKAITDLYNSKDRYDVFNEIEKSEKESEKGNISSSSIIIWNAVITFVAIGGILIYDYSKYKKLNAKLEELSNKLTSENNIEKVSKNTKSKSKK